MNTLERATSVVVMILFSAATACAQNGDPEIHRAPGMVIVVGATVGVPTGVTFTGGVIAPAISLKASGGYWGKDWNGAQLDLGWVFSNDGVLSQEVALLAGAFRVNPRVTNEQGITATTVRQSRYLGLAYEASYAGFFLQAGLGVGNGDYPNPQFLFQAGYLISIP